MRPSARRRSLAAAFAVVALLATGPAAATQAVTLGTAGVQGIYHPLGRAICRMVNISHKVNGLRCTAEPTDGSVANIRKVMSGELTLGLAQSDMQYRARAGEPPFAGAPQTRLRALFSVYPELFTVVARPDAHVEKFADLKGKRVSVGGAGSGTRVTMDLVMAAQGLTLADFAKARELPFAEFVPALCDRKIDAFVYVAGHPNPVFQDAITACGARLVALDAPVVDAIAAGRPYYRKATIPAGVYGAGTPAVATFGTVASVVVSADMPEATAYAITKSVFDSFDDFRKRHPALGLLTPAAAVEGQAVPLHPGAVRYFREAGLMR